MKQGSLSHLLLIGFGWSLLLSLNLTQASCVSMQMQHQYPYSPSLTIETSQAPDEGMLPTGYNHSIICISNISEKFYGNPYYGQPYWIQIFFNDAYVRSCGGRSSDSEDLKICTYPIVNSVEADSGNYSCVARNQLSCIIGTLPVKFEKPTLPTVTLNPPQDFNVSYGSTVNFSCEATGFPKPEITWYKDSRPLFGRNIQNVQGISQLTLESVTSYDGGEYWCEAKNSEGWRTSINTTIKVLSMPVILVHPSNVSLNLEETNIKVIFFCKVIGFPRPSITWLKNDSTLTGGMVVQNGSSSFLVLQNVTKEETFARYKCIAKNSLGKVSSKEGVLVVREQIQHSDTPKKDFDVGLKLKGEFKQEYENLENPETKMLVKKIEKNMMEEFKGTGLTSVKVLNLRQGSIIADLKLTFNDSVGESSVNALLTQATNRGKIGDMEVEEISVGKTFPEPTTTSVPPEDCGTFFEGEDCKKDLVTVPGPVPSEPAKVNKDAIYGSVIGVLAFMFAVAIILNAWKRRKREKDNRGSSTCNIMTTSFTQAWIRLLFKNCGNNSYHNRRKSSLPHTPNNRNFKTRCVLMLNPVPFIMQLTTKGSTLPVKRRKSRSKVIRCC